MSFKKACMIFDPEKRANLLIYLGQNDIIKFITFAKIEFLGFFLKLRLIKKVN